MKNHFPSERSTFETTETTSDAQLALHFERGGDLAKAAHYLPRAARELASRTKRLVKALGKGTPRPAAPPSDG